ncbi:hypothetical protein G6F60_014657 [Rhizopus arrhizus]|nr:hypothetical protein G6F60_014657 [Rhizopus arrhizus]
MARAVDAFAAYRRRTAPWRAQACPFPSSAWTRAAEARPSCRRQPLSPLSRAAPWRACVTASSRRRPAIAATAR